MKSPRESQGSYRKEQLGALGRGAAQAQLSCPSSQEPGPVAAGAARAISAAPELFSRSRAWARPANSK